MANRPKRTDIIDIAARGYMSVWEHRKTLAQMALFPMMVKCLTVAVVVILGLQENLLRQGLLYIPSFFVEGWFIAAALRLVFYHEAWPSFLTGDAKEDAARIAQRRKAIQACGILYTLLRLVSVLSVAMFVEYAGDPATNTEGLAAGAPAPEDIPFIVSVIAFAGATMLLMGSIWAYRYFCLYVPVALGRSIKSFLKAAFGFKTSFHMIFVSMLCFMPFFVFLGMFHGMWDQLFTEPALSIDQPIYTLGSAVLQSVMELSVSAITAVATGVYMMDVVYQHKKK